MGVISRVLQKIQKEKAEGVMVVPVWPTQTWYTSLLELLVDVPRIIQKEQGLLKLPHSEEKHSMKITLMACRVSGSNSKNKEFRETYYKSSKNRGEDLPGVSMQQSLRNGQASVVKGVFIFFQPTINDVLEFLLKLYKGNLSYSCINTARSALSCFVKIDGTDVGKHPLVSRFMKGIFQLRPTLSRYNEIWDVDVVFDYIRNMNCNEMLSLKQLTLKTVSLVALISSQRVQSIHNICLSNMNVDDSKYVFYLGKIKQSRPSCKSFYMSLERFPGEENLCIFKALSEYLKRTESIRNGCDKVFISYLKPHKQVSKNTIARWIKTFLGLAGINIKKFSAHSTRAASSSAAIRNGVPITEILNKAGWSSEKTFFKYYNLDVTKTK